MNRWDDRYRAERYYYGTEPNQHVARSLNGLPRGRGLFLAEGEGRNAVHAAALGHDVVAVDTSEEGRRKALLLAAARGVTIDYVLADATEYPWDDRSWDFIVLCFYQLQKEERRACHRRVAAALRPGGTVIVQSFSTAQFGRSSGGPPNLELLYSLDELPGEFPGVHWELVREREVELDEGVGHRGLAMVIEMVGRKEAARYR